MACGVKAHDIRISNKLPVRWTQVQTSTGKADSITCKNVKNVKMFQKFAQLGSLPDGPSYPTVLFSTDSPYEMAACKGALWHHYSLLAVTCKSIICAPTLTALQYLNSGFEHSVGLFFDTSQIVGLITKFITTQEHVMYSYCDVEQYLIQCFPNVGHLSNQGSCATFREGTLKRPGLPMTSMANCCLKSVERCELWPKKAFSEYRLGNTDLIIEDHRLSAHFVWKSVGMFTHH